MSSTRMSSTAIAGADADGKDTVGLLSASSSGTSATADADGDGGKQRQSQGPTTAEGVPFDPKSLIDR